MRSGTAAMLGTTGPACCFERFVWQRFDSAFGGVCSYSETSSPMPPITALAVLAAYAGQYPHAWPVASARSKVDRKGLQAGIESRISRQHCCEHQCAVAASTHTVCAPKGNMSALLNKRYGPWIDQGPSSADQCKVRVRVLAIPQAGMGAWAFHGWEVPETVEVLPVELPGRNSRMLEPKDQSMRQLVVALVDAL